MLLQIIAKRLLESKNGVPHAYLQAGKRIDVHLLIHCVVLLLPSVLLFTCVKSFETKIPLQCFWSNDTFKPTSIKLSIPTAHWTLNGLLQSSRNGSTHIPIKRTKFFLQYGLVLIILEFWHFYLQLGQLGAGWCPSLALSIKRSNIENSTPNFGFWITFHGLSSYTPAWDAAHLSIYNVFLEMYFWPCFSQCAATILDPTLRFRKELKGLPLTLSFYFHFLYNYCI